MGLDYTKRARAVYGSRLHKESQGCIWGLNYTKRATQREPGLYTGLDYTKRARAVYGSKLHKESQGCMWVY